MTNKCERCGQEFDAKRAWTKYCEACLPRVRAEKSAARAKNSIDGNPVLAAEREQLGLTVRDMAEHLGVSEYTYYNAEHYGKAPGTVMQKKMAEISILALAWRASTTWLPPPHDQCPISILALAWRASHTGYGVCAVFTISILALAWRASKLLRVMAALTTISILALAWRASRQCGNCGALTCISILALAWRASKSCGRYS